MMEVLSAFLVTLMFFISGINKVKNFNSVTKSIQKKFIISTLPLFFYKIILILVILKVMYFIVIHLQFQTLNHVYF